MEEAGYLEAQTKLRTSYLCRDLVRPLSVSLYDRIPFLAAAAAKTTKERQRHLNNFMMDFENHVLREWDARGGVPRGPRRFENKNWAALMKSHLEFSDTCWEEYVTWVQQGGGDEWFQEEE